MSSSSRTRFEIDPRTGIAAARVDPAELIADSNPVFGQILAADPADLDLEVRGDPRLFRPVSIASRSVSPGSDF
jgi:hypothetical protein